MMKRMKMAKTARPRIAAVALFEGEGGEEARLTTRSR